MFSNKSNKAIANQYGTKNVNMSWFQLEYRKGKKGNIKLRFNTKRL